MRVLLSGYDSRGGIEPLAALAAALHALGAEAVACVPPDEEFAQRFHSIGVPVVPVGKSLHALVTGAEKPTAAGLPQRAAELVAAQFAQLAPVARECDAVVATGVMPAVAGARSVAEKLGLAYSYATFQQLTLPTPHHPPRLTTPGEPFPPDVKDNRALWDLEGRNINALLGEVLNTQRKSIGLSPVDHVREYVITRQPLLATDPVLDPWQESADLGVVRTGAWVLPDERPLPSELVAFLEAGAPPVYVGFGSMPMRGSQDGARVIIEAVRAQGRRVVVSRGWAGLSLIDSGADCLAIGEVNQQALFGRVAAVVHHGGAGTTHTAARAGAPQVVVPQGADQPYWAGRVTDLGIGAAHDGPIATVESLSAALKAALTPRTHTRAKAVAATMSADGAMVAAKLVLDQISVK
ncbi:glycosyltransferase [Catelliglobosispora koreensis]|uniref:glycosyltransferase n=1 Tax=Catelliglobosispora koreensis TaxID=129052 RepID=UPI00036F3D76|nr:glycosyltransferase [Catelliglobosispora koreensis]